MLFLGVARRTMQAMAAVALMAGSLLAAGLIFAGAVARQDSPAALDRAFGIETRLAGAANADHLERMAEFHAAQGNRDRTKTALERAVQVDPRRATAWIALGLLAERGGDWAASERELLEAARLDHQYLPAWTLANFYFRRANRDEFWKWARRAAALTYDEFPPLLRLADGFDRDPARVLARLGDSARIERGYLTYLIGRKRLDAAQAVASRLAARRDPADALRFADLASRQIAAGRAPAAIEAWNVFHTPALDPAQGSILIDPDLRSLPTGEGFDWALGGWACPGVAAHWSPGRVRFDFSGGQPDFCVLLSQTLAAPLPEEHPRRYRLSFEYCAQGQSAPDGLDWDFGESGKPDAPEAPPRPAFLLQPIPWDQQNWLPAGRVFAGVRGSLARLRFVYRRPPGKIRYEGSVWLRQFHWEVL